ncbi:nuclear body protein SP140-like protein [Phyllostomus discolor]|uniref:Nuclear body protein SP140-like protein n=1 Tax=Phyllostomus discolor TaxID=89673 RepID=A0A7E6DQ23_9CHIR|nr:nuclear body protein SP140-like protein [Phyllostomus discolor]
MRTPVEAAVYDILTELQETFDLPLLRDLFSNTIMKKYPDLCRSYTIFKREISNISNYLESDAEENKGRSDSQLSLEQGTDRNSYPNLPWSGPHPMNYTGTATSDNGLSNHISEEEISVIVHTTTGNSDALESQQANEQCAQQSEPAGADLPNHGIPVSSSSIDPVAIKKEKPFFNSGVEWEAQGRSDCNQASDIIDISSEDSVERRNREEAPEPSTSTVKRKSGTVNPENNSIPQKAKRKRRTGQQPDEDVNFEAEILPVSCGKTMGLLIKRKLERGATRKCIRTEDGNWFTPREFEIRGGYEKANNWRDHLTCGGKRLRLLIELGFIHPPPTTKKVENSGKCVICQDGGKLVGCATCPRVFHEGCHLPPVGIRRNAWKCTYCTIGNPPRQHHYRESEVLVKVMGPEEKLKCAFLLLNVYGPLESKVFPNIPHENYVEEASRCLEKLRKLDKIKEKLNKGDYPYVEHFVQAMNEFFTIPSCSDAEFTKDDFKKTFKKQFAIQETN